MNPEQRDLILLEMHADLAGLHQNVLRLVKAVDGNGRPGLLADVAVLKEQVTDIDTRAPSKKERYAGWVAIIGAISVGVASAIKAFIGG